MTLTLSNGIVVEVQSVPPFALAEIERRFSSIEGLEGAELKQAQDARARLAREAAWLMALPDVTVPENWEFPRGLRYAGIQAREGEAGELLDYIEYGLLCTPQDIQDVQRVMYGADLTEEDISTAEATFQPDGGSPAAAAYPTRSE
jgi:hypothetical protein